MCVGFIAYDARLYVLIVFVLPWLTQCLVQAPRLLKFGHMIFSRVNIGKEYIFYFRLAYWLAFIETAPFPDQLGDGLATRKLSSNPGLPRQLGFARPTSPKAIRQARKPAGPFGKQRRGSKGSLKDSRAATPAPINQPIATRNVLKHQVILSPSNLGK